MKYPLLLLFSLLSSSHVFGHKPCLQATAKCQAKLLIGHQSQFSYFRTFAINVKNDDIKRVVIVVHGIARNASEYFAHILRAVVTEKAEKNTLVIVPYFKKPVDNPSTNELYWDEASWYRGDNSDSKEKTSSYTVMDVLIKRLLKPSLFPNLREIIITGHSAGGQFVARYSGGTKNTELNNIRFKYVIANPSSYLYLSAKRAMRGNQTIFKRPKTNSCKDYNHYQYGLLDRNSYMKQSTESEIISRFSIRNIIILVGEADTKTEYLDTSCEANLQGKNRFERGVVFYNYLRSFIPKLHARLVIVPAVGHSDEQMYNSSVGRNVLFSE